MPKPPKIPSREEVIEIYNHLLYDSQFFDQLSVPEKKELKDYAEEVRHQSLNEYYHQTVHLEVFKDLDPTEISPLIFYTRDLFKVEDEYRRGKIIKALRQLHDSIRILNLYPQAPNKETLTHRQRAIIERFEIDLGLRNDYESIGKLKPKNYEAAVRSMLKAPNSKSYKKPSREEVKAIFKFLEEKSPILDHARKVYEDLD